MCPKCGEEGNRRESLCQRCKVPCVSLLPAAATPRPCLNDQQEAVRRLQEVVVQVQQGGGGSGIQAAKAASGPRPGTWVDGSDGAPSSIHRCQAPCIKFQPSTSVAPVGNRFSQAASECPQCLNHPGCQGCMRPTTRRLSGRRWQCALQSPWAPCMLQPRAGMCISCAGGHLIWVGWQRV